MKNLSQLQDLDEMEMLEEIWNYGTLIGTKTDDLHKIDLYSLHEFYIEKYYKLEHNILGKLNIITREEILDGYLNTFDGRAI